MKNIEKFEKEITERVNNERSLECSLAIIAGFKEGEGECDKNCEECHKRLVKWMYSEYKKPVLTDEEKYAIGSIVNVITALGISVKYLSKEFGYHVGNENLVAWYENNCFISLPDFEKGTMFKGMKVGEKYTLEELGL